MAIIKDYASLTQAIADWTHRADLTAGTSPFSDYFIQSAQEAIENDIYDLNFGNGIALQETPYGPYPITNGVVPVPTDWLTPKFMTVADGQGDTDTLIFKSAAWIYDAYPQRTAAGVPAYIARDVWQSSYAAPMAFTATSGQTVFNLGVAPSSSTLAVVSLDGASLTQNIDYTLSGTRLTLANGAIAGQTLAVQLLTTVASTTSFVASSGQNAFALTSNPNSSVVLVTLDGSVLSAGTDYLVAGGYLTLASGAQAGQTLVIYFASGSVFIFAPYPDGAYTVQGTYYQKAPLLSYGSATTSNWMTAHAGNILLAASMVEASKFLKDATMLQGWGAIYQERLKALVDRDKAERWSAATMQVEVG